MPELTCRVIDITRGTTHDGPGLRTTVFFKGCPLACAWCQNPEGIPEGQDIWWEERTCIRCLTCVEVCPGAGVSESAGGMRRDPAACTLCGRCVEECPARAMTFTGQDWGLEALLAETLKDREYYRAFGGGVTASGGEPLSQFAFVAELFRRLRAEGVHTALDTCGLAPPQALRAVLPHTDAVLFDIKLMDPELHRRHTGRSNPTILDNLAEIAARARRSDRDGAAMRLWVRTPLVPGATATPENLAAIGAFLHDGPGDVVERWELCAFNSACRSKYRKLGLPWAYADEPLMGEAAVAALRSAALSAGFPADRLVVSGLVARP